jgi:hypothetical protein
MQSALSAGGEQLSALRTQLLSAAGQATSLGGLVSDDGSVRAAGGGRFMTPALAAAYTALLKALLTHSTRLPGDRLGAHLHKAGRRA